LAGPRQAGPFRLGIGLETQGGLAFAHEEHIEEGVDHGHHSQLDEVVAVGAGRGGHDVGPELELKRHGEPAAKAKSGGAEAR
jgi:hypothetical protein